MTGASRIVKILGYALLYLGIALIGIGIGSTWYFHGFGAVQELLSPFNVVNVLATALTLAPGILLIMASEKLDQRVEREEKLGE